MYPRAHVCLCVHVCVCQAPGCLHVVVILVLMKEFSASPLRLSLQPGLGWGEGEKDEGEMVKAVVGEDRGKK